MKSRLLAFIADIAPLGVTLEVGKTALLRWRPSPQTEASAGFVEVNGKAWFQQAFRSVSRAGSEAAGEAYLEAIARIVGGQVKRYEKDAPEVLDASGHAIDAARLLDVADAWKGAIAELVTTGSRDES